MTGYETEFNLERVAGPVSVGIHTFNISAVDEKAGPSGQYLNLTLECIDPGDDNGKNVFDIISLTPKARFKMEEFLNAIGAPVQGRVTGSMFVGRAVRAQIGEETYQATDEATQQTVTRTKSAVMIYIPAVAPGAGVAATVAPPTPLPLTPPPTPPAAQVTTPPELGGETKKDGDWDVPF